MSQILKAKAYLNQVPKLNKLIENKQIEIEMLKSKAMGVGSLDTSDRVQSSMSYHTTEDAVCAYIQIEQDVKKEIDALIALRHEIISTIEQLPIEQYDLLHMKYIQGRDFIYIMDAYSPPKSYSWVTTMHGRALNAVQKILDARRKGDNDYEK